jgi:hypothetical protein
MSGRKSATKKRKVAHKAVTQRVVNAFGVAASKNLPQPVSSLVLSFLEPQELYQLPEVSKDVGEIAAAYFSTVREWIIAKLPKSVPSVLRSCRQLQSLCIDNSSYNLSSLKGIAVIINHNADTLRRLSARRASQSSLFKRWRAAPTSQRWMGLGAAATAPSKVAPIRCAEPLSLCDNGSEYGDAVCQAASSWTKIERLGIHLEDGSSRASQLSSETAKRLLSKGLAWA